MPDPAAVAASVAARLLAGPTPVHGLYRLPDGERIALAATWIGYRATITVRHQAAGGLPEKVTGTIVAVARMRNHGSTGGVLIVQRGDPTPDAYSLATVNHIERSEP